MAAEGAGSTRRSPDARSGPPRAGRPRLRSRARACSSGWPTPSPPSRCWPSFAMVDRHARAGAWRPSLVVVCADVRDPGNAGTVLRSADAAGAGRRGVAAAERSTRTTPRPCAPRPARSSTSRWWSSRGSGRGPRRPRRGWATAVSGAVARGGDGLRRRRLAGPHALVLGNEAAGLSARCSAELDGTVAIPMAGRAESLNVGVACAVLCFEALRQRRQGRPGSALYGSHRA